MFYQQLGVLVLFIIHVCNSVEIADQQYIENILNEYESKTGAQFSNDKDIMNMLSQYGKGLDPEIVLDSFLLTVRMPKNKIFFQLYNIKNIFTLYSLVSLSDEDIHVKTILFNQMMVIF